MATIAIVEDEQDILELIKQQFSIQDYHVLAFTNGDDLIEYVQKNNEDSIDLFILDRMLPGSNGIEVCRFLRFFQKSKHIPILMLTALTRTEQVVEGLDAGADDYVTKPFDMNVLMARVRSLIRRSHFNQKNLSGDKSAIIEIKDLKVDTNKCKAWVSNNEVDLTLSEYKLLVAFMQSPGKVLTRNQLVSLIQEGPVHVTDRTIDTHVFGLRKKLKESSSMVETIRGIGYRVNND